MDDVCVFFVAGKHLYGVYTHNEPQLLHKSIYINNSMIAGE